MLRSNLSFSNIDLSYTSRELFARIMQNVIVAKSMRIRLINTRKISLVIKCKWLSKNLKKLYATYRTRVYVLFYRFQSIFFLLVLFKNVALLLYDWRIIILLVILITQILSVHSCEKKYLLSSITISWDYGPYVVHVLDGQISALHCPRKWTEESSWGDRSGNRVCGSLRIPK